MADLKAIFRPDQLQKLADNSYVIIKTPDGNEIRLEMQKGFRIEIISWECIPLPPSSLNNKDPQRFN